jgi:hypothetical protein
MDVIQKQLKNEVLLDSSDQSKKDAVNYGEYAKREIMN